MKRSPSIATKIYPAAAFSVLIIIWELIVWLNNVPEYRLPAPSAILSEFVNSFGLLMYHAATTVVEALIGFVLGVALSVFFAVAMSMVKPIKLMFYPFMIVSQTIPLVVIAPLLAIWFGFGIVPKIIMSVVVVFFPVTVSLTEGLGTCDEDLVDLMKVMKASKRQIYRTVLIPNALPSFFAGMKISAAYCIMGAVISEWTGASRGLGIYLSRAMSTFKTAALFSNIAVIILLSLILFKIVDLIEKKVIPWNKID
ncbi:MAG: ABC transporter permease [Christensenellales bacterium]|jgi:putative hydroxymethylpyrimidine transport system permease protein